MRSLLLSCALMAIFAGCGSSSVSQSDAGHADARATDAGPADAALVDGMLAACPAVAPSATAACTTNGQICRYEHCDAEGLTTATCDSGAWSVSAQACDAVDCQGYTCGAGTVCAVSAGGALIVGCVAHTCGDGPLSCDCVCGEGVECSEGDSYGGEGLFTCNTCGSNLCP